MKLFKSNCIIKRSSKWTGTALLFIIMMAIVVTSCSKSGNDNPDGGGGEAETAWLIGYRKETPQGRIYYMETHENLPSNTNPEKAVELGLNSRIYSYGENPYTWNGDAATITKWEVDKSTMALKTIGIISFGSTGIKGNIAKPAFISETQAYTTSLTEGVVVEWNPSTMEITKIYKVAAFPELGVKDLLFEFDKEVTADGKILIPIETNPLSTCCDYPTSAAGARTAIFDPVAGTVTYHVDKRAIGADSFHYTDPVTGSRYSVPTWANSFVLPYYNNANKLGHPHSLLKVNDDGSFDPNYEFNLDDVLDMKFYFNTSFIYDNKIVLAYVGDDYTWGSFAERANVFAANTRSAQVDLVTREVKPFEGLKGYNYNNIGTPRTIDGKTYLTIGISGSNAIILQQNAIDNYTDITKHSGGNIEYFNKLW